METFVPLYISNKCDSYCIMCGFKHSNTHLQRRVATIEEINEQLDIILNYEKVSAVCILTGELFSPSSRMSNLQLVCEAMNLAIDYGFEKIFFNIGSLSTKEIKYIQSVIKDSSKIVLSLFQETYDPVAYKQFFGANPDRSAKANFENRLATIDRWIATGFSAIDIGILLGFKPIGNDVSETIDHALRYIKAGIEVYISTPRIKNGEILDIEYIEILKKIYHSVPGAKLIITTREKIEFINSVIEYISVVSPGSSDICPYSRGQFISNNTQTSQFVIDEKRMRPFDVLKQINTLSAIRYFNG